MKRLTSILAISVIAVMSAGAARADIASTTYVDNKVSPVSTKANTNAGEIKTLKETKENVANKVKSGGDMEKALAATYADTKYPTLKATMEIAQIAAGAETGKLKALANYDTVSTDLIDDGAVTSAKILDGTIAEEDLSKAVKDKLNATVQTFNPASATEGKYVTNFTKDGTTVTATTAYVQIPVGSATAPTSVASIWVE